MIQQTEIRESPDKLKPLYTTTRVPMTTKLHRMVTHQM